MESNKIEVIIEWSGDNFTAFAEVDGVVAATADDIESLKKEFESALVFHLDDQAQAEFEYVFAATAVLKILDGTLTRSAISRYTNINERQLGHYIQGNKKPRKDTEEKIFDGIRKIRKELGSYV